MFASVLLGLLGNLSLAIDLRSHAAVGNESLSQACGQYLEGFFVRIVTRKNLKPEDHELIRYSGRWTNELGQFENCVRHPNMSYYNIQIGIDVLREALGVCMTDKCTAADWAYLHAQFKALLDKSMSQPSSPYYAARDYFKVDFTRVHPPDPAPLRDAHALTFLLLVAAMLCLVLYATVRNFVARSGRRAASAFDGATPDRDLFQQAKLSRIAMPLLDAFDLRRNLADLSRYPVHSATQFSIDFTRLLYYILIFAFQIPFVHSEVSKVLVDKTQSTYYSSGPTAATVQAILFLPLGLLCVGGYTATHSVFRSLQRFGLQGFRQSWWKYVSCYVGFVIRRYLRLVFGLALGALYAWKILPLVARGPMRSTDLGCTPQNFLSSALLIKNDFAGNDKRMCGIWYFYFAMDFRMHAFVPIICSVHLLSKKTALGLAAVLMVSSLTASIWYNQKNGIRELHSDNGYWIADVMTSPYLNAFGYFLGTACSLLEIAYFGEKATHRCESGGEEREDLAHILPDRPATSTKASSAPDSHGGDLALLHVWPHRTQQLPKRLLEWVGVFSLFTFISMYSIYYFLFQNDNLKSSEWPQWRHTVFNSVGIMLIGVSPVFFFYCLFNRFSEWLLPKLKASPSFVVLRSIYFEMAVCGVPLLLTMLFSYQSMPYFDPYLVNNSVNWEVMITMAVSVVCYLLLTKPFDLLITNIMKM